MNELKNRGVNDIFIACCDGLKGFPEAIEMVFPKTKVQLCIVHQVRNSLKYVSYKVGIRPYPIAEVAKHEVATHQAAYWNGWADV